jgi:hypothetical protein
MSLRHLYQLGLASAIILAVPALRAADATLLKKTGSVTVTPQGGQATELNVNDKIPDGATVKTGPGAEAYIQPLDGAIATMKANTTVEIGTGNATINLKSGNLVSTIDPAKKVKYSVRTPKGVAAARGTAFSTAVDGVNVTVASTADTVTMTIGGQVLSISAGMVSYTPAGATQATVVPLAQAAASNPAIMQMVQTAVQTMSAVIQNNVGNMSAASATSLATQVVAVASAAAPSQAASFTSQVVTAMTSPTASTATSAATTSNAIASVATAAAQASPGQAAQVASAAVQAAPAQTGVVTAAVSQAVPSASTDVVNSVAQTTGQSTSSIQTQSNAAQGQASAVVGNVTATNSGIVTPSSNTQTPSQSPTQNQNQNQNQSQNQNTNTNNNNQTPITDPSQSQNVSGAGGP